MGGVAFCDVNAQPADGVAFDPRIAVDEVADAVLTASRLLVALSARSIADVDDSITITQFRVLVLLHTGGALNLVTLARQLDVQPSTATRMIDRLANAHLVVRVPSERTRRELAIELTARGTDVVRTVTERRRAEISAVVGRLTSAQQTALIDALTVFTHAGGEPQVARHTGEPDCAGDDLRAAN